MNFIELGKHKIEVCVENGIRMVKYSDIRELLDFKENEYNECFIDAGLITDTLFNKIYVTQDATKEQDVIFHGLCMVGIYALIDEVCKVDLKNISYNEEFKKYFRKDPKQKIFY
jgi:hypothetical protein